MNNIKNNNKPIIYLKKRPLSIEKKQLTKIKVKKQALIQQTKNSLVLNKDKFSLIFTKKFKFKLPLTILKKIENTLEQQELSLKVVTPKPNVKKKKTNTRFVSTHSPAILFLTYGSYFLIQRMFRRSKVIRQLKKINKEQPLKQLSYSPKKLNLWHFIIRSTYAPLRFKRHAHKRFFRFLKRKIKKGYNKQNLLYNKQHMIPQKIKKLKTILHPKENKNFTNLTITIKRTVNNLFITAFNHKKIIVNCSSGKAGFPGPKKLGVYTAEQIAKKIAKAIYSFAEKKKIILDNKDYKPFTLILKSPLSDFMVKAAVRCLIKNQIRFGYILHFSKIAHNGSQVKKKTRK